jgi:hypothetical protein
MKFRTCSIALLLLALAASVASAATYSVAIPCTGTHVERTSYMGEVDFGRAFSSIQSVKVNWAGHINGGAVSTLYGTDPYYGTITLNLRDDTSRQMGDASISGGENTFPAAFYFNNTTNIQMWYPYDFLMDGKCGVSVAFRTSFDVWGLPFIQPSYVIDSMSLVLDGTPAPEPGSILALLAGIGGCIPFIRRRK